MIEDDLLRETLEATAKVLSRRLLLLVGMVMTFVLACWAMINPSWGHLIAAGGFGALMWVFTSVPAVRGA